MGGVGIGGNYPKEASKLLLEAAADARLGLGVGGGGLPGGGGGGVEVEELLRLEGELGVARLVGAAVRGCCRHRLHGPRRGADVQVQLKPGTEAAWRTCLSPTFILS